MRQKTGTTQPSAEKVIKDIRRMTRKQYGAVIGSVSPRSSPMTGFAIAGLKPASAAVFSQTVFAVAKRPNHSTASCLRTSGAYDKASAPPPR